MNTLHAPTAAPRAPAQTPAATASTPGLADRGLTLCLGPGGLPGVDILAGVWLAMAELGLRPARVSGCSAGALVAAVMAAGRLEAHEFASVVGRLDERAVLRKRLCWKERVFWLDHFVKPGPIAALLAEHLPDEFQALNLPLTVVATCMGSANGAPGGAVREWPQEFSSGGDLRRKVLASMSIPGVFPYVELAGRRYSDGATTEPFVLPANFGPEERVMVCQPVRRLSYARRDRNVLSRLLWGAEMLARRTAQQTRERLAAELGERLLWLELDLGPGSALRFQHDLILDGYCQARRELRHWWPAQKARPSLAREEAAHA